MDSPYWYDEIREIKKKIVDNILIFPDGRELKKPNALNEDDLNDFIITNLNSDLRNILIDSNKDHIKEQILNFSESGFDLYPLNKTEKKMIKILLHSQLDFGISKLEDEKRQMYEVTKDNLDMRDKLNYIIDSKIDSINRLRRVDLNELLIYSLTEQSIPFLISYLTLNNTKNNIDSISIKGETFKQTDKGNFKILEPMTMENSSGDFSFRYSMTQKPDIYSNLKEMKKTENQIELFKFMKNDLKLDMNDNNINNLFKLSKNYLHTYDIKSIIENRIEKLSKLISDIKNKFIPEIVEWNKKEYGLANDENSYSDYDNQHTEIFKISDNELVLQEPGSAGVMVEVTYELENDKIKSELFIKENSIAQGMTLGEPFNIHKLQEELNSYLDLITLNREGISKIDKIDIKREELKFYTEEKNEVIDKLKTKDYDLGN